MTSEINARNMMLGALLADAAAMGLHWIYDQNHIRTIAPANPEFRQPNIDDYTGVPGYFAHARRQSGDQSQYGYQALVMLHSLADNHGQYDVDHYAQKFKNEFGYGGNYVGYIDNATRQTLDNFRRSEDEALARANALPFDGGPKVTRALVVKALALKAQASGEELRRRFEEAVRITHNDDEVVAHGFAVLDQILDMKDVHGAVDEQFPAISKLPALVAITTANKSLDATALSRAVESAIRVTSDHPNSFAYGEVCAQMLISAMRGDNADAIIHAGRGVASTEVLSAIESAVTMQEKSVSDVTAHFGMACDLKYGVPSIIHNIATASSFKAAIRQNIYAGGDTCGRSILLGAIMGATYGVGGEQGMPEAWIEKLLLKPELDSLLDSVFEV